MRKGVYSRPETLSDHFLPYGTFTVRHKDSTSVFSDVSKTIWENPTRTNLGSSVDLWGVSERSTVRVDSRVVYRVGVTHPLGPLLKTGVTGDWCRLPLGSARIRWGPGAPMYYFTDNLTKQDVI